MRAKLVLSLMLLFSMLFISTAHASVLTDPENYKIYVGEKTFTITVDHIGSDESGNTTVTLAGFESEILSLRILINISCNGEVFTCKKYWFSPTSNSIIYFFDTTLQPQSISLYNNFVPNLVEFNLIGSNTADETSVVLPMKAPFEFELGNIVVDSIENSTMFSPADMTDDQRAVMVVTLVDLPLTKTESEFNLLYENACLVDIQGNTFHAGVALSKETEADQLQYTLIFAVPKELATENLIFSFEGQSRSCEP